MTKKNIIIVILSIIIVAIFLYVMLVTLNIRGKMNRYLTDKGETASIVESIKIKRSFINILLSYNECIILVKYYDEPEVIYSYTYKNNEIVFTGVSGGTKDKDELLHFEKQFNAKILEIYSNESIVVEPNEVKK